jgi:hypothetical protein
MTSSRSRVTLFTGLAMLGLALLDVWALWQWTASRQQLAVEQHQLESANRLAQSIRELRRSPEKLDATARSADALAKLIESSAQQVGLGTERIVHIAPSEPRRIGNSAYLEQVTGVELREVSLKQLVDLTRAVGQTAPRLTIPSVAIRMPPGDLNTNGRPELWNIELTLTGHVYEPKMPASP